MCVRNLKVIEKIVIAAFIAELYLRVVFSEYKALGLGILIITIFTAISIFDELFCSKDKHNSADGAFSFNV